MACLYLPEFDWFIFLVNYLRAASEEKTPQVRTTCQSATRPDIMWIPDWKGNAAAKNSRGRQKSWLTWTKKLTELGGKALLYTKHTPATPCVNRCVHTIGKKEGGQIFIYCNPMARLSGPVIGSEFDERDHGLGWINRPCSGKMDWPLSATDNSGKHSSQLHPARRDPSPKRTLDQFQGASDGTCFTL